MYMYYKHLIVPNVLGISSKTTDQDQIARYRSLLLGEVEEDNEEDKPDDVDMEITFEPTLDELESEEEVCSFLSIF